MYLTEEERDAREGRKITLAVNHAGSDNLCGPIVSCGIALDYNAIPEDLIVAATSGKPFEKDTIKPYIGKAIKAFGTYSVSAAKLNEIQDIRIAEHLADYNALMSLVFDVCSVFSNDPDVVQTKIPVKEVIKNKYLAMYKNNNNESEYVAREGWTQFDNLIPNTMRICYSNEDTFSLLFAKTFAETVLQKELKAASERYPEYDFTSKEISEEQRALLNEKGMTEYHRAFLPQLSMFAFSKRILL